jgi:hypothetical protein
LKSSEIDPWGDGDWLRITLSSHVSRLKIEILSLKERGGVFEKLLFSNMGCKNKGY